MKINTRIQILWLIVFWVFFVFLRNIYPGADQKKSQKKLETLGYLTWVPARNTMKKKGVTRYIRGESFPGFNLYNSRDQVMARLMDMNGKVVHRWKNPGKSSGSWQHVEPCPNGDLLVIVKDKSLVRLDWNSRVKWEQQMRFHHDLDLGENGDIYTLSRKDSIVIRKGWPYPVIADYIVALSAGGQIRKVIPFYPLMESVISGNHFRRIYQWLGNIQSQANFGSFKKKQGIFLPLSSPGDILHANTVEIITRSIDGLCEKGDLLVSFRELDLIGIVDKNLERLRWSWGPGILQKQHHPVLLQNGNILVFDNGEPDRKYSRILEINPLVCKVVWKYMANPPRSFFSLSRGGNQRLPNGNTLITESDRGRVFEVTPDGKIVWEFYNPRIKKNNKTRAAIYRMTRIWDDQRYPFLNKFKLN